MWKTTVLAVISLLNSVSGSADTALITGLSEVIGSVNGGTYVKVLGSGFAENTFNFGDGNEHLGNKVYFVSASERHECVVEKDGSDENVIGCTTSAMDEITHYVEVEIDGVKVPAGNYCNGNRLAYWCTFTPRWWRTPELNSISPASSLPEQEMVIHGRIYTDLVSSAEAESNNGVDASLRRVWIGGQKCELYKSSDELYGVALSYNSDTDSYGNYGTITCKLVGNYVGSQNVSFIVDSNYGASRALVSAVKVSGDYKLYHYQSYAELSAISPATGSNEGGTRITLTGSYLADTSIKILIGDQECQLVDLADTTVTCDTPALVTGDMFAGGRGIMTEIYPGLSDPTAIADVSYDSYAGEKMRFWVDQAKVTHTATSSPVVVRISGYFVPAKDGTYLLSSTSANTDIYLSTDHTKAAKIQLTGATVTLVGGNYYYFEAIRMESSTAIDFSLKAQLDETDYVYTQTSSSMSEVQEIVSISPTKYEIQTINLTDWTVDDSPRNEVHTICVTCATDYICSDEDKFSLKLFGISTAISSTESAASVQNFINSLVTLGGDQVTVVKSSLPPENCWSEYTITVGSTRGKTPFKVNSLSNNMNVTVTITTSVLPAKDSFTVALDGVPSLHVPYTDDGTALAASIANLFGTQCPTALNGALGNSILFENFEGTATPIVGELSGEESYCGSFSLKNPSTIFLSGETVSAFKMDTFSTICLAYKGLVSASIQLSYTFTDFATKEKISRTSAFTWMTESSDWTHVCVDALSELSNLGNGYDFYISSIVINLGVSDHDFFIDNLYIGSLSLTSEKQEELILLRGQRRLPSSTVRLQSASAVRENDVFTVTMVPIDCAYDLPLLEIAYASKGVAGVYSHSKWGDSQITVVRTQAASAPPGDTFDLTLQGDSSDYGGTLTDIAWDVSEDELKQQIQSLAGITTVNVERTGDCRGYTWRVTFLSPGGKQGALVPDGTNFANSEATISASVITTGGLYLNPIPGDWLRTASETPQVQVLINNVPSKCSGDCSFQWDIAATPTITDASLSTSTVTVTGTGFSATATDNTVTIGGVGCTATGSTETSITCTMGESPGGPQDVVVNVAGKGVTAAFSPMEVPVTVTSISPSSGGALGGTLLTLMGTALSSGTAAIQIGDSDCTVKERQYTTIVCITGPSALGASTITASFGTLEAVVSDTATYEFVAATAVSDSTSQAVFSVAGGQSVTFSGSGFGASQLPSSSVTIGDQPAEIQAWSDTGITVTSPSLVPGSYTLKIYIEDFGYADTSALGSAEYVLLVTNVAPTSSSLMGGVVLAVTGEGYNEEPTVMVGDTKCTVESFTDTSISCTLGSCGSSYTIENTGEDEEHGIGYAWSPSSQTVKVGDEVTWSWSTSSSMSNAAIQLHTVANVTSVTYDGSGFQSGSGRSSGVFKYRFNLPGTYYYGGCANSECSIFMRGVVIVNDPVDVTSDISVTLGGHQAIYQDSGSEVSAITFTCQTSLTPIISNISPNQGTSETVISITGSGFSATADENTVTVGDASCTVQSAVETLITCKVGVDTGLTVGLNQEVNVVVAGKGSSRKDIRNLASRYFALLPHVASVSPAAGSTAGGSLVTISGGGLSMTNSIVIGDSPCTITAATYTTVTCTTGAGVAATEEVTVTVFENSVSLAAACESTACTFAYDSASTPSLTDASPLTVTSSGGTLTLTGNGFGSDVSLVSVTVGSSGCTVTSVTDTGIECTMGDVAAGDQIVGVGIQGKGKAATPSPVIVTSSPVISSVSPQTGSVMGGTVLTIQGNGFSGETTVTIGGVTCTDTSVTPSSITCTTAEHEAETASVKIISNSITYPDTSFEYSAASTPAVTAISPITGQTGDTITITGTSLMSTAQTTVELGDVPCAVTSAPQATSVECTLGSRYGGAASIQVYVEGLGLASVGTDVTFDYILSISSITPSAGSLGGGQSVVVTGNGFSEISVMKMCGMICASSGITATTITCSTPSSTTAATCDLQVINGDSQVDLPAAYTYDASLTPQIDSVSPTSGGTAGGTTLTITGSGLTDATSVAIDGSSCTIDSASHTDTNIQCVTDAHTGSVQAKVTVTMGTNGDVPTDNADFYYVDRWSSTFTWGNGPLPQEGDFVVIQEGQTVLLDTTTEKLVMLLIQGGTLIFEDAGNEVNLHVENILVTNGGVIQIGTEEEPYQSKAMIQMHGHLRSTELPIYGAKTLGVREGRIEMHGKHIDNTWTLLDQTAAAAATEITLDIPVTWSVGDRIVIASTGLRHSQEENEEREIATIAIVSDKTVITLTEPLEFEHLGITETYTTPDGTYTVDFRAEVGLLTRNIVFRGSDDVQWHDTIERCAEGFNTGMFATQTCFQGRFGEEVGSDQFGASIMMHTKDPSSGLASAHIEYVELTYVGQAFRLGRYPIHWHLMGNMTGSYVRGCAIHKSFNRAVTIHNTHNLLVERNVIYDIMGGAVFIEDGIETQNVIQYNLAVFVKQSTSLLNDDITPAAYWVTNPDNILQHNHAAGGTHFGFWYRMHEHPDAASFDVNICQQNVELGVFQNNTVHSQGWFGLWIFQTYHPKEGGSCGSNTPQAAKFHGLTTWNCEKGAEWVDGGAIQFHDFVLVNNEDAGIDVKMISGTEWDKGDRGALIKDTVIVGHSFFASSDYETTTGIALPLTSMLWLDGIHFINIDRSNHIALSVSTISGTCTSKCGGFYYYVENLKFHSVSRRVRWAHEHHGVIRDIDGSLTGGAADTKVVAYSATYSPDLCEIQTGDLYSSGYPSSICDPSIEFVRLAFNHPSPTSLESKDSIFINSYGNTSVEYLKKRITHKFGWMVLLQSRETYQWKFQDGDHFTNISYNAGFYRLGSNDYVIMQHDFSQKPDRIFMHDGDTLQIGNTTELTSISNNLDWHYDIDTGKFSYIITGKTSTTRRKRVAGEEVFTTVTSISPNIFRCYYRDCLEPIDTSTISDVRELPDNYTLFTNMTEKSDCLQFEGDTAENNDITIPVDCWVMWSMASARVNKITVQGNLGFDESLDMITLSATHIIVQGRLIAGWAHDDPHKKPLHIILRGNHSTPDVPITNGLNLGAKAIGCLGSCDLHGLMETTTWVRLGQTASAASSTLHLRSSVDWVAGQEIIITTTSFNAWQTEKHVIASVSDDGSSITTISPLAYEHKSQTVTYENNYNVDLSAEVGLLTRSIKIEGEDYEDLEEESFGARVLVATSGEYRALARFSNVEFYHSGQFGYTDSDDPRYSIAWKDGGGGSELFSCSFHDGFASAVGVFGTNGVNITNNVIHHTVSDGMVIEGSAHNLEGNLVALNIFPGSYQDRKDNQNWKFPAAINMEKSKFVTLKDNVVAGAERLGFKIVGQPCTDNPVENWSGNVARGTLHGVHQMLGSGTCALINGFVISKAWDYGIYHQTPDSVIVRNCAILDSTVGYLPLVVGPAALTHTFEDKFARVENSLIVARTDPTDCTTDMDESNDDNLILRRTAGVNKKAASTPTGGRSGVMLPLFASGYNGATFKPFSANKNYPALHGKLEISGVTIVQFGEVCSGQRDIVFYTNPDNEDAFHPTYVSGVTLIEVEEDSMVLYDKPSIGKINPSDCVDMQCDAKIKVVVKDMDGSFLGAPGAILPQSERDWGSEQLGLGDYRIPKPLLTEIDGTRIPVEDIAPDKGIVRNSACTLNSNWQAYKCPTAESYEYKMLVIESLDDDTETRRLSPVALLCNGYIDLINGPQDHGWCAGYTCQKRISTFYTLVAVGNHHTLMFTSTPPSKMRLHLLDSDADDMITLGIWIPNPQTLQVQGTDGEIVQPKNLYVDPNDGRTKLAKPPASDPDKYTPEVATASNGDNFIDKYTRYFYVAVGGENAVVTITTLETLFVTFDFPLLTVDEFFGDNLIVNLAAFLGISSDRIRIVDVVSETSRKKRSTETESLTFEMTDPSNQNDLRTISRRLTDSYQDSTLNLGSTVSGISTTEPSDDETKAANDATLANGEIVQATTVYTVPVKISLISTPSGEERSVFSEEVVVHLLDADDTPTATSSTWKVIASLIKTGSDADASAVLSGTLEITFVNGIATFSDLQISHSGTYQLQFSPSHSSATLVVITSSEFTITERTVTAELTSITDELIKDGGDIQFQWQLKDGSGTDLTDIAFKGLTWKIEATLEDSSKYDVGTTLGGTMMFTFDSTSGQVTTSGLALTGTTDYYKYNIKFRVYTDPTSNYDFTADTVPVQIYPALEENYIHNNAKKEVKLKLKYTNNYDDVMKTNDKKNFETYMNNLLISASKSESENPTLYFGSITATKSSTGKIEFETTVFGQTTEETDAFVSSLSRSTDMSFDGTALTLDSDCGVSTDDSCDGSSNGDPASSPTNNDANTTIIVFAVLGSSFLLAIAIITFTCLYKRSANMRKINALRCMNNSQASADSSRPLSNSLDSFQPGVVDWATQSPDSGSYRMTPVV